MKTAIYIEDGISQVVLTPETEFEQRVIDDLEKGEAALHYGSFYNCQGGWTRHKAYFPTSSYGSDTTDKSLIIRIALKTATETNS